MGTSGEPSVTLEDVERVFEESDHGTPLTVREVAAELDCPHRSAERNLTELATRGELETKRIGDERIWWRAAEPDPTDGGDGAGPDDGTEYDDADRWDAVVERITDAFYALDDEWRFTHLNERAEEILQRSEDELLGERIWDEFPESADGFVWEKYHEAMENQSPVDFDLYYEPLDVWAEINAYPSETGLSVYFVDISERVETERELSRYRRIIETVNDGVYTVNPEGNFTMVNEAYAEMVGYDREDLLGEPVSTVVADDVAATAREIEADQLAGECDTPTLEAELRTAEGDTIVAEATFALLSLEDDEYERIAVVRDVTERREYERKIEEQRERYRRLVEAAPVAILTCDADGRIALANEAAAALFETEGELVGTSLLDFVHDDDRAGAADRLHSVLESREAVPSTETKLRTAGGAVRHAITTSVPITRDCEPAVQVVLTDITERKRYEERLNETVAELERSNERLDRFASMLAHELRNPLNVAEIYADQISSADSEALRQVTDALDRIEEMIAVLLVLAKGSDVAECQQAVPLDGVATEAWSRLDTDGATLDVDARRTISGDHNPVHHLFENLFRNALKHAGEGVTVRVGDLDAGFYVEDDGDGIPDAEREAVFEAGHSSDDGLGLGLTYVARLAEAYDWTVEITESEAGGARFEFTGIEFAE
ncbi:PAS domain S-box protein [Halorussus gelatinilyticus]|uniref:histidine kinase n=1 Tax=Halorussus gelatinilyticus TaxID=2937524 RepID=A0A8U0IHM2_9EURY|nr:PAS domain S-box protein [Halorussus gelatinilyticus]UPW00171.1 PAS domain S-box protein [Halorussus gelatinilyticus]